MRKGCYGKILCMLLAAGLLFLIPQMRAQAGTGYVRVPYEEPVKAGKLYFELISGDLYCGSSKTDMDRLLLTNAGTVFTNGKTLYYVAPSDRTLCRKTLSTGLVKKLKKLPRGSRKYMDDSWQVSAVKGKNVYLTRLSEEKWCTWTYAYRTGTGKLKKLAKRAQIKARSGNYAVVQHDYRSDVSAYRLSLYKLTSSGMKKIRSLGKYCFGEAFCGGYVYYMKYSKTSMGSGSLYRCKANGKGKAKKLGSFEADEWGQVLASDYTSKKCTIHMYKNNSMNTYTYTYKGKKLVLQ